MRGSAKRESATASQRRERKAHRDKCSSRSALATVLDHPLISSMVQPLARLQKMVRRAAHQQFSVDETDLDCDRLRVFSECLLELATNFGSCNREMRIELLRRIWTRGRTHLLYSLMCESLLQHEACSDPA